MTVLGVLLAIAGGQTERWVYSYNGPGNNDDYAYSLVAGTDGNMYAAGYSWGSGTAHDFTVISLTPSDSQRWVYRYNGPGNNPDEAYSIVAAADGNIYAAGVSQGSGTGVDFTVISLTSSGSERWVYRFNGQGNSDDWALSLVAGADGNIYAAGRSYDSLTGYDFMVVSLTSLGSERWVYRYNGPGDSTDWANSIVSGADGNIYAAGYSVGSGTSYDFTVISLTSSGSERWVYRYNGPGNDWDWANSVVAGADGNIYAAGISTGSVTGWDFTVISLTSSGSERWVYRYSGSGNSGNWANSIIAGTDGNIYAAGQSYGSGTYLDFTVISLTSSGSERWVYRYNGPGNGQDWANSIVAAADGDVYATGMSTGGGAYGAFTVISLTSSGSERWVYRYNGPGFGSEANSIVAGADGNIYAAGENFGYGTWYDLTIISLNPVPGIAEAGPLTSDNAFGLAAGTIRNHVISYTLKLPEPATVSLSLCDLQGRKLASWQVPAPKGTSQHTRNLLDLSPGVYFLKMGTPPVFGAKAGSVPIFREGRKLITVK
jgi:uncharacterized delta-60 repeat protein